MNTILDEIIKEERKAGWEAGWIDNSLEIAKKMIENELSTEKILYYLPNLNLDILNSLREELQ